MYIKLTQEKKFTLCFIITLKTRPHQNPQQGPKEQNRDTPNLPQEIFHEKTNQNQAREGHNIPDIIVTKKRLVSNRLSRSFLTENFRHWIFVPNV